MSVGDYVRTKFGQIGKLKYIGEYNINIEFGKHIHVIAKTEYYKSSPNIIDLIEVDDYVNGMLVIEETPKDKRKKQQIIVDSTAFEWGTERLFNEDIKSIVTKEQFSQMEYKVGD